MIVIRVFFFAPNLVPDEKENLLSRQLIRPTGLLSPNSTPHSTPRATPSRGMSPMSMTYHSTGINLTHQKHSKFMSPKFYAVPHSRVAEEGETIQFQCAIAGHPLPWTTWDKDGQIVTPTTRITVKERDDLRILEISEVTHEDAGLYRITLENEYGRVEASARLDIIGSGRSAIGHGHGIRSDSSPYRSVSVSRRLMGSSTRIGGRLTLASNFRGTSAPTRKFYHNGIEIDLADSRMNVEQSDAAINLTIENVQARDEGIWTCIAENEFGIAASSTYITLFQEESEIVKQAPEFVRTLESINTIENGNSLDLTCQVQSFTPFDIQWKYNSKMISFDSDEHRLVQSIYYFLYCFGMFCFHENSYHSRFIDHGDGLIALRILNPLAKNSGSYTCMIASDFGCCTTSCEITIKEQKELLRETIPNFMIKPLPVVAMHGSVVSFCARVEPIEAKVKWFICGREVTENSRGIIVSVFESI